MAREQKFTEHLNVMLEEEQMAEIRAIAQKQKISMGEVTRWLVRRGLVQFYSEKMPYLGDR